MKTNLNRGIEFSWMFLLSLLLLLYPTTGFSFDNDPWNTALNFHFTPPGARALAMGGAFVGLADDATAAASNPAGLAQLSRTQLAVEGRYVSRDDKGKSFDWTGSGISGTEVSSSHVKDVTDISFGAITTPLFNNFINISIFYDKPVDYKSNKSDVSTVNPPDNGEYSFPRVMDISIDEIGLSVAKGFLDNKIMVGFGMGIQFVDVGGTVLRLDSSGVDDVLFGRSRVDYNDTDVSWRGGILVKPMEKLRLGASFTIMPKFDYTVKWINNFTKENGKYNSSFDVPDNVSFGAAYNIMPNWVVIAEGRYIWYSQLMSNFQVPPLAIYPGTISTSSDYSIDDIFEIHIGTEYVLNTFPTVPIAIRTGFYYEPAHDLEYNGSNDVESNLFDGGEDLYHFTLGTGAVFFNHYQVDFGADFTKESTQLALSMVYQF